LNVIFKRIIAMEKVSFTDADPGNLLISQRVDSIIGTALNTKMMKGMIEDYAACYHDPGEKERVYKAMVAELLSRLEKELKND
jgi:hypothetical protein